LQEGRNADRLRNILRSFPMIVIPRVLWRYTTKFVITEEFCPGIKIDKLALQKDTDLKRLAKYLVEAYLVQILEYGYFHADPHAGNLAISSSGGLIIYDFGMMGCITDKQRIGLVKLMSSIAENNMSVFVDSLVDLGFVSTKAIADKNYLQELIEPLWVRYHSHIEQEIELSQLEREIDIFLLSKYIKLPANLAYLIRMIVALEANVRILDPNLNFFRVAEPYFKKIRGQLRYN
jgi:predicted unusual protein kinase regulating ubiquinone biosynthesis (AarF/ABC1/UbiB family)